MSTSQRDVAAERAGEEGASATVLLLSLMTLLAVTMLAIDGGSLYVSRRGQVADTDAAALAATRLLTSGACSTSQTDLNDAATEYLGYNDPAGSTTLVGDVEVTNTSSNACATAGTVEVTTERDARMFFAPLFGYTRLPTGVSTTVVYGPGAVFPGVRPIGICGLDAHYDIEWEPYISQVRDGADPDGPAYTAYETAIATQDPLLDPEAYGGESHPDYAGADHVHRITFERTMSGGSPCPGAPGSFGFLDFDSGGNQATCDDWPTELTCGIAEGADVSVDLGGSTDGDEDCNDAEGSIEDCPTQTGGLGNSTAAALDDVLCPAGTVAEGCETLQIVVYEDVSGNGNNARFDVYSIASIVLRGYEVGTGNLNASHYLDIEFVYETVQGVVGTTDPGGTSPPVAYLCGVNDYTDQC